jgi:hypothetical protein
MNNKDFSAGTKADSDIQPMARTSRPTIGNTHVACKLSSGRNVLLLWLVEIIVIVTLCCLMPQEAIWFIALFANGMGLFFGFLFQLMFENSR